MVTPTIRTRFVLSYRWLVFLLAAGYCVYQIFWSSYEQFGGPFRYLTIWALFLSFYAASRMIAIMEERTERTHHVTAMTAAVLNCMVLLLYWRLYFIDPNLVNGSGPINPWREYYLHGVGPVLQIIDALFISRAFGRPWLAILPVLGLVCAYVAWAELIQRPLNDAPVGTVTDGLPYPFLNDLAFDDRAVFYLTNIGVAVFFLAVLAALGWLIRRAL